MSCRQGILGIIIIIISQEKKNNNKQLLTFCATSFMYASIAFVAMLLARNITFWLSTNKYFIYFIPLCKTSLQIIQKLQIICSSTDHQKISNLKKKLVQDYGTKGNSSLAMMNTPPHCHNNSTVTDAITQCCR